MGNNRGPGRSLEPITIGDLRTLARFAKEHREQWFLHKKKTSVYENRFLCSALCQGAARHYVDGVNGVKDFDIYEFYAEVPAVTIPYRAHWCYDFGPSKFGRQKNSRLHPEYEGRRIDLFVRALKVDVGADPVEAVQKYLKTSRTTTATLLAEKAVVILEPEELIGTVAWPIERT